MHRPKVNTLAVDNSPDELYGAALTLVQGGKYALLAASNERHRLIFTSGRTALSWGQVYVIEIDPAAGGHTHLKLTCGGVDDAPRAMLDGVKNSRVGHKFIAAMEEALATGAARPAPVESFVTVDDQGTTQPWDGQAIPERYR
ncbi:MAG: hypothetical protein L0H93_14685 [Nocardioides sp.]|nr:hypothetical protein [Nocardioides sp.]